MSDAPRIQREERYNPVVCMVGTLIASVLLWSAIAELVNLVFKLIRWLAP